MSDFEPVGKGYYALIRSGAETAEALPGKVHDVLVISSSEHSGFPPVVQMEPQPDVPDGKVLVRCYRRTAEAIELRYRIDDAPQRPPRTFSKLKVVTALTQAGVWPQVKAWIEQAGLYDLYLAAQDFAEDNEYFTQGRAALQTALGWTDEQVEAVLAAAEVAR